MDDENRTRVQAFAGKIRVSFEILGKATPQERRTLGLAILEKIEPLLGPWKFTQIVHSGSSLGTILREFENGASSVRALRTDTPQQRLGYEIRIRRLQSRLSQADLAEKAGVSRLRICRIERGQGRPHPATLRAIEAVLGPVELEQKETN
jgi:DNA-binding XRE family transcriptional regulator